MTDKKEVNERSEARRTAGEAGWHVSRYNLSAPVPGKNSTVIANLFKGVCAEYSAIELYLFSVFESLDEHHPIIEKLASRGVITQTDELAALESMGRIALAMPRVVSLTICPTMSCNFDCPYCFEYHQNGKMSRETQDDVVSLAERMLKAIGGNELSVTWFGGEPLLATDVIEDLSEKLMALAAEHNAAYRASIITNGYLLDQKNVELLARCRVQSCQVTIDGLGAVHDETRHLSGGGPTFTRIVGNLREGRIPFPVHVRQNVQESNRDSILPVRDYILQLAAESGNRITWTPVPVFSNEVAENRVGRIGTLCGHDRTKMGLMQEALTFAQGRGYFCGANRLFSVSIDAQGRLFKCPEATGVQELFFGNVKDWNPEDPLNTAAEPDNLTKYLNAMPLKDEECQACVWLPQCVGGCPHQRLFRKKSCVPFKERPEEYVMALYQRLQLQREKKQKISV